MYNVTIQYLTFNCYTETEGSTENGAGRCRRPHDSRGEEETAFSVCDLDPLGIGRLIQSLDRDQAHLALLAGQGDHQLLLRNVFNLKIQKTLFYSNVKLDRMYHLYSMFPCCDFL
jgi:hypothetical protein